MYKDSLISSSPLQGIELSESLTKEQMEQYVKQVEDVLALHRADPVVGLEVWKAMHPRLIDPTRPDSQASSSVVSPDVLTRRKDVLAARSSSILKAMSPEALAQERVMRLARSSAYPHRVLVGMDESVAKCSAVELQRRIVAVNMESRRFENDVKRWRATMDREGATENVDDVAEFHALEEELLEAKIEDLQMRLNGFNASIAQQKAKFVVVERHARNVLGASFDDEIPRIVNASHLKSEYKDTLVAIRDLKSQREADRQNQARLLLRADRKIERLAALLEEKQAKALLSADLKQSTNSDKLDELIARRAKRAEAITEAALENIVSTEEAQRLLVEQAELAAVKIIRSQAQSALLAFTVTANAAVLNGPEFAMPLQQKAQRRSRR